jgi:hypothetical protein
MSAATFRTEERLGLIVAVAAHIGLFAWLALWRPVAEVVEPPETVAVTLSEDVGLVATTPEPSADPAPAAAPMIGDSLPPPVAEPLPRPELRPDPPPLARAVPTPTRPVSKPTTRPTPPRRDPIADLLDRRPPGPKPTARPTGRPTTTPSGRPTGRPTGRPGGSAIGTDFLDGVAGARGAGQPLAQPGPAEVSSIRAQINKQLLGPWNACTVTGLDIQKLRAEVTFTLDRSGGVVSVNAPVVSGVTESNRPQVKRFGECAVRAVRQAAPFKLPPQYYDHWKTYKRPFRKE